MKVNLIFKHLSVIGRPAYEGDHEPMYNGETFRDDKPLSAAASSQNLICDVGQIMRLHGTNQERF